VLVGIVHNLHRLLNSISKHLLQRYIFVQGAGFVFPIMMATSFFLRGVNWWLGLVGTRRAIATQCSITKPVLPIKSLVQGAGFVSPIIIATTYLLHGVNRWLG
jgi:hypothetical protein